MCYPHSKVISAQKATPVSDFRKNLNVHAENEFCRGQNGKDSKLGRSNRAQRSVLTRKIKRGTALRGTSLNSITCFVRGEEVTEGSPIREDGHGDRFRRTTNDRMDGTKSKNAYLRPGDARRE